MPERGHRAWAAQVPQIRIGVLGGENEADCLGRYGPYAKLIEETFQVPTRLFQAADYAGVLQAFSASQIEMSNMSPAAYACAWLDSNGGVEPILVTREADGSTSYIAAMYVRADSGITSLEQMRGKSMAWADPNSASGYLIPRAELRTMRDKGMLDMKDIRIIWRSRPIQNGPVVVRKALPAAAPDFYRAVERGSAVGWTRTQHEDYQVFVDMRRAEAQERRRRN